MAPPEIQRSEVPWDPILAICRSRSCDLRRHPGEGSPGTSSLTLSCRVPPSLPAALPLLNRKEALCLQPHSWQIDHHAKSCSSKFHPYSTPILCQTLPQVRLVSLRHWPSNLATQHLNNSRLPTTLSKIWSSMWGQGIKMIIYFNWNSRMSKNVFFSSFSNSS